MKELFERLMNRIRAVNSDSEKVKEASVG
jgi:hypothetical protein